jgi:hypothetical protein
MEKIKNFMLEYLKNEKNKNSNPSQYFLGSLVYRIENEFMKKEGLKSYEYFNSDYPKIVNKFFGHAVNVVFGKGAYQAMKNANKYNRHTGQQVIV